VTGFSGGSIESLALTYHLLPYDPEQYDDGPSLAAVDARPACDLRPSGV